MSQPGSNVARSKEVGTVDAVTLARLAADAIADKKGQDIVLLEVGDLFVITEVFVIATGNSRPHVQSLADRVEEMLKEAGRKPLRDEGPSRGRMGFARLRRHHGSRFPAYGPRLLRPRAPLAGCPGGRLEPGRF